MKFGMAKISAMVGKAALAAAIVVSSSAVIVALPVRAEEPPKAQEREFNPQMVALGQRIWKEKVACNDCHGWSGNGVPDDSRQPVGANLRATKLTAEQIAEVVKCGRPSTGMPHFDPRAYEDDRCYGLKAADLGAAVPPFIGVSLIPREIQAVVEYVEAKMVGRGAFTRADCEDYFGQGANVCNSFTYGGTGPQGAPPPGTLPIRGLTPSPH